MKLSLSVIVSALEVAAGLARGGPLPACTGTNWVAQMEQQSNCVVISNPTAQSIVSLSFTNDPTYVNTPISQTVNNYQTTLTAILNGGTTVFQEVFNAPFSDPSVQGAILAADAALTSDGATFGSPLPTSNLIALQSSVLSYVATSPVLDYPTLLACGPIAVAGVLTCSGVTVTVSVTDSIPVFGPVTIMTGLGQSDEFPVLSGQEDVNINTDYTYSVDQNAVTTSTYLTTQSYVIDGTTGTSTVPEPGTFVLAGCGLGLVALRLRAAMPRVP